MPAVAFIFAVCFGLALVVIGLRVTATNPTSS
jgi:hypothetical protein